MNPDYYLPLFLSACAILHEMYESWRADTFSTHITHLSTVHMYLLATYSACGLFELGEDVASDAIACLAPSMLGVALLMPLRRSEYTIVWTPQSILLFLVVCAWTESEYARAASLPYAMGVWLAPPVVILLHAGVVATYMLFTRGRGAAVVETAKCVLPGCLYAIAASAQTASRAVSVLVGMNPASAAMIEQPCVLLGLIGTWILARRSFTAAFSHSSIPVL